MPLSATDIVQSNSGTATSGSPSATLGFGTTAGNTVVVVVGTSTPISNTTMSGFTQDTPATSGSAQARIFCKTAVDAETSWTISNTGTGLTDWRAYELAGIDNDARVDAVPTVYAIGSGTSITTYEGGGSNPATTSYDVVIIAAHVAYTNTSTTPATFSGHDQGFTEDAAVGVSGASTALGLSVSLLFTQALLTPDVSATRSDAAVTSGIGATHVAYTAAGAKKAPDVRALWGMEWGTAAGLATGVAGNRIFNAITGTPAVTTSTPRTGSYCLECSAAAAVENVQAVAETITGTDPKQGAVVRVCFRFVGGLPAADTEVFSMAGATSKVRYVAASGKLGLQVGTGTEVLSDATVAADQWIAVDLRVMDIGADWAGDWTITYDATPGASSIPVAQTQATFTTASSINSFTLTLGWTAAATATIRYDDIVCSGIRGHYPLGDHQVRPLLPDPAGTLTITGTAGNFALMTANATGAAFDAATALTNISDLPPVIGASASGFCQTAVATGDYINIPMETYQAAPAGSIRAVKMYACGWAASATAATIGLRAFDGVTEHTLLAAADPEFDNSTTDPAWVAKMVRTTVGGKIDWTQALLDGLVFRVGRSGDATPDIGIHSIMAEVAEQIADTLATFGTSDDVLVNAHRDPLTGGVLGLDVTTPVGRGADLTYEVDGSPSTLSVAGGDTDGVVLDAPDAPTVNYVKIEVQP